MKTVLFTLLVCACNMLAAQETKLPLEIKNAHLYSQWKLNDTINASVFLETGFPKIVFSETFAKKHLQGVVNMTEAENTGIALWNNQRYTVTYLINDSLTVKWQEDEDRCFGRRHSRSKCVGRIGRYLSFAGFRW